MLNLFNDLNNHFHMFHPLLWISSMEQDGKKENKCEEWLRRNLPTYPVATLLVLIDMASWRISMMPKWGSTTVLVRGWHTPR